MTVGRPGGAVVDTMVISRLLDKHGGPVADRYRALIDTRPVVLAFRTVMKLRHGALGAGWGELGRRRLERRVADDAISGAVPRLEMLTVLPQA